MRSDCTAAGTVEINSTFDTLVEISLYVYNYGN
jgi:hypothetical protein